MTSLGDGRDRRLVEDLKVAGKWQWSCTVEAESHSEALRKAMACVQPEHYDKPLRLEQDTDLPPREK